MTTPIHPTIAIFGHYGNKNLGDESITQAMAHQLRKRIPDAKLVGMSINPFDTAYRHNIESFPIRRLNGAASLIVSPEVAAEHFAQQAASSAQKPASADNTTNPPTRSAAPKPRGWKQTLKATPVLGPLLKLLVRGVDLAIAIKDELIFLKAGRNYAKTIDLIIVTGSNQFLDNFGGAWGFPYTLLKWSLIARSTGTRFAFASVGAGPLKKPLSFWMLGIALRNCDFLSYRDEGSKKLVEDTVRGIEGHIFPDIAHGLDARVNHKPASTPPVVAVNPMPVYDARYWPIADANKYNNYLDCLSQLCKTILSGNSPLVLFSTQARDADVIVDVIEILTQDDNYANWKDQISVENAAGVDELMAVLVGSDIVVATRFHATVLPLQLDKPVLGICYYRKAAELLDDVGLGAFHVDIDDFTAEQLIEKFERLVEERERLVTTLSQEYTRYAITLDKQFDQLAALV